MFQQVSRILLAQVNEELIGKELTFPDGVRLMNRPATYNGGKTVYFQRAEQGLTLSQLFKTAAEFVPILHVRIGAAEICVGLTKRPIGNRLTAESGFPGSSGWRLRRNSHCGRTRPAKNPAQRG